MKKILYLDIDGVLNSQDNADALLMDWETRNEFDAPYVSQDVYNAYIDEVYKDKYGVLFDERCVMWLSIIIAHTGAQIIISSDWRKSGLETMLNMWSWEERNLPGEIVGITPVHEKFSGDREGEIVSSVNHHLPDKWVAVDDMHLDLEDENFVHVDPIYGLDRVAALQIIKKLS